MGKNKINRAPLAWPLVLAWLSGFLLVVVAAILVLLTTVCSKRYMQRCIDTSDFSTVAYTYLCDDFTSFAYASGFAPEVLTGQISVEQINTDIKQAVANLYAGDTAQAAHEEIFTATFAAMQADAQARGIEWTDAVQDSVSVVADACRVKYSNSMQLPLAGQMYTLAAKLNKLLWPAFAVAVVLCAASLILCVKLSRRTAHGLRCLIYAGLAAAVVCGLLATVAYPAMHLGTLSLEPLYLKLFLLSYIQGIFTQFGVFTVVYIVLSVTVLVLLSVGKTMGRRTK